MTCFEIVRYKAIVEEIFQTWIPKYEFPHTRGRSRDQLYRMSRSDCLCSRKRFVTLRVVLRVWSDDGMLRLVKILRSWCKTVRTESR